MNKVKIALASLVVAGSLVATAAPALAAVSAPVNYFQKYNIAKAFGFTRFVTPVR